MIEFILIVAAYFVGWKFGDTIVAKLREAK